MVLLFVASFFALPQGVQAQSLETPLERGVTDERVRTVQQALNTTECRVANQGVGSSGEETDYFGAKTETALLCYQVREGLSPTGTLDAETFRSLYLRLVVHRLTRLAAMQGVSPGIFLERYGIDPAEFGLSQSLLLTSQVAQATETVPMAVLTSIQGRRVGEPLNYTVRGKDGSSLTAYRYKVVDAFHPTSIPSCGTTGYSDWRSLSQQITDTAPTIPVICLQGRDGDTLQRTVTRYALGRRTVEKVTVSDPPTAPSRLRAKIAPPTATEPVARVVPIGWSSDRPLNFQIEGKDGATVTEYRYKVFSGPGEGTCVSGGAGGYSAWRSVSQRITDIAPRWPVICIQGRNSRNRQQTVTRVSWSKGFNAIESLPWAPTSDETPTTAPPKAPVVRSTVKPVAQAALTRSWSSGQPLNIRVRGKTTVALTEYRYKVKQATVEGRRVTSTCGAGGYSTWRPVAQLITDVASGVVSVCVQGRNSAATQDGVTHFTVLTGNVIESLSEEPERPAGTPPSVPQNVQVASAGGSRVTISWDTASAITESEVSFYTNATCTSKFSSYRVPGSQSSYTLDASSAFYVTIRSQNEHGWGGRSACMQLLTSDTQPKQPAGTPPSVPRNVQMTSVGDDVRFTWDTTSTVMESEISFYTNARCADKDKFYSYRVQGSRSSQVLNVTSNLYFTIRSRNEHGWGGSSACVRARAPERQPEQPSGRPSVPQNIQMADAGRDRVRFSWYTTGTVTGSEVTFYSDARCANKFYSEQVQGSRSSLILNVTSSFYFTVRSQNEQGWGERSACAQVETGSNEPEQPAGTRPSVPRNIQTASVGGTRVQFTWEITGAVTGSEVSFSSDASCASTFSSQQVSGSHLSLVTDITSSLYFTIRSQNEHGWGGWSSCAQVAVEGNEPRERGGDLIAELVLLDSRWISGNPLNLQVQGRGTSVVDEYRYKVKPALLVGGNITTTCGSDGYSAWRPVSERITDEVQGISIVCVQGRNAAQQQGTITRFSIIHGNELEETVAVPRLDVPEVGEGSVSFRLFSDRVLSQERASGSYMRAGDVVYAQVTFPGRVQHVPGSGSVTATSPKLYYRVGSSETAFAVKNHHDTTVDHGDCHPHTSSEGRVYICQYTVAADSSGLLNIGARTADGDVVYSGSLILDNTVPVLDRIVEVVGGKKRVIVTALLRQSGNQDTAETLVLDLGGGCDKLGSEGGGISPIVTVSAGVRENREYSFTLWSPSGSYRNCTAKIVDGAGNETETVPIDSFSVRRGSSGGGGGGGLSSPVATPPATSPPAAVSVDNNRVLYRKGQEAKGIVNVQIALNSTVCKIATSGLGSPGNETLYFGAKTEVAVICYQRLKGLPTTGILDLRTGLLLQIDYIKSRIIAVLRGRGLDDPASFLRQNGIDPASFGLL